MANGPSGGIRVPLSLAQEQMWWIEKYAPTPGFMNQPLRHRFSSPVDPACLAEAVGYLTQRHESLRTTFPVESGEPYQSIAPSVAVEIPVTDLRYLPPDDGNRELIRLETAAVNTAFDTAAGPLFSAQLFLLDDDESEILVVFDHLVSDPTSEAIFVSELDDVYRALSAGKQPALERVGIDYADFAVWQRRWMTEDRIRAYKQHWASLLKGVSPIRMLPYTTEVRDSTSDARTELTLPSARYAFKVPAGIYHALRQLPASSGYVLCAAAVATLVACSTGETDTLLVTSVSGRDRAELSSIVGDFGGMSILRTDLTGDPTFEMVLQRVQATVVGVLEHQHLPLYQSLKALSDQGTDVPFSALPVAVHFFHAAHDRWAPGDSVVARPPEHEGPGEFDIPEASKPLEFRFFDDGATLWGELAYHPGYYDVTTATHIVSDLKALLAAVSHDPRLRLSQLPVASQGGPVNDAATGRGGPEAAVLTAEGRHRILVEWNDTVAPFPDDCGVHHLVQAQADRTPDSVAVAYGDRSITYAELDASANRLAGHLRSLGVEPDVVVGLCVERSVEMIVALLAILKAGGAYLPLDPTYPAERLSFMLDDSAASVVVSEEAQLARLPTGNARVVCVDGERDVIAKQPADRPAGGFNPGQLAYVIYTSGSTGRPKGVEICHRNVVNLLTHMARSPGLSAGDVLANLTTPAFDLSVPDLFLPLVTGAVMVVISREVATDGRRLALALDAWGADLVQATPTTWRMLIDAGWGGRPGLKALCGGEAMPPALAGALLDRQVELWNMYGPTEATVWSTSLRVTSPRQAPCIGRPIANTTIYILDESLQPVPIGIEGELHIGGAGLARGYLGRPDLTAERFIAHPFDPTPGARAYKTGDLARWRPDGTAEFLGRLDHQVKVRGFRIELGEIEAVLDAQPGVRAAVVTAGADPSGGSRLIAYVVPESPAPTTTELRHRLLETLPVHMVPSAFVTLDALPLTPNGKVDRKALPVPEGSRPDLVSAYIAPRTSLEHTLAAIWGEVLDIDTVGVEDDFFEIGGHSLLAVRAVGRINHELDADLAIGALYQAPTVAQMARVVAAGAVRTDAPRLVALDRSAFPR